MTFVSVSEAATLVQRDRKSLYRDIATGKLSAVKDDKGRTKIDVSELLRAFGPFKNEASETPETVSVPHRETDSDTRKELESLRIENARLKAENAAKDANLSDLRRVVALLEHHKEQPSKKRWWPF